MSCFIDSVLFSYTLRNCCALLAVSGSGRGSAVLYGAECHSVWDCFMFQARSHQGLCDSPLQQKCRLHARSQKVRAVSLLFSTEFYIWRYRFDNTDYGRMQMLPVALFGPCVFMVPMATHGSFQRAAAYCEVVVCSGCVEQLNQLQQSIITVYIPFTPQCAVREVSQQTC